MAGFVDIQTASLESPNLKIFKEPRIDSKELTVIAIDPPAYVAWRNRLRSSLKVYKFGLWAHILYTDKDLQYDFFILIFLT